LQIRIRSIPLIQDAPLTEVFSVDVKNNTYDNMYVYTDSIIATTNKTKNYFSKKILLLILGPGYQINMKNICVQQKSDHGCYAMVSSVEFEQLDVQPYDEYTKKGEMSVNTIPHHYKIGYTVNGNIDPKEVMILTCDHIIFHIDNIRKDIEKYLQKKKDNTYEFCEVYEIDNYIEYKLLQKTSSIGKLFTMDIYLDKKDIPNISYKIDHPSSTYSFIRIITSDDPHKLMINCAIKLIGKFEKIKKTFE
jgi:DNA-directed RNA polymerase subunit L